MAGQSCLLIVGGLAEMRFKGVILYSFVIVAVQAQLPQAEPVVIKAEPEKPHVTDEKGEAIKKRPSYFSILLGNRFSLPDANANPNAVTFSDANILRTSEQIYKSTGAAYSEAGFSPGFEPALRIELEMPFERIPFLPASKKFAAQLSFEGSFTTTQNLLSSSGPFRYQNNQANAVELQDVTYSGNLTVTEKRQSFTPMLGIGAELASEGMQRMNELRFLVRVGAGVSLQNGQRSYDLQLNPQYISTTSNPTYSDTYVIKSSITQSYATAVLFAGRVELGLRMRLAGRMHLALIGSMSAFYGVLPYDNVGSFTEQAGQKQVYQKIITGISDEDSFRLIPAVFLALSVEL